MGKVDCGFGSIKGGVSMTDDSKGTILNVNDSMVARRAVSYMLHRAGFKVIEAGDGTEALQRVKEMPDLVLVDVLLPDIDGFEVCRRMKDDPMTSLIPVLHLSATYQDDKARAAGLESGADGYLTFPVESVVLVSSVNCLFSQGSFIDKTPSLTIIRSQVKQLCYCTITDECNFGSERRTGYGK